MAEGGTCFVSQPGIMYLRRWSSDGASIFSVEQGKALAQTPHKPPTPYERLRAERMARAQLTTPIVQGYRLLPEFTPGRCALRN